MTSISIPAGITSIDPAFFQLFPNGTAISVDSGNSAFTSYNGMLFDKEFTSLLLVPEGKEGIAVLPVSLATVPACVLSRCTKLSATTADLAEGSTSEQSLSFRDGIIYTRDLRTLIAAPAGIGASVAIAPECTSIAEGAFWGNDDLATIVVPGNVASILVNPRFKSDAASNADALAEALTTDANTDTALAPVPSFMEATTANATIVTENRAAWEQAGFKNFAEQAQPGDTAEADGFAYTLLDDFTLSVRWVGEEAPEELTIPQTASINDISYSVSSIERDAFRGESSIRVLTIPEGVRTIGTSAFEDCTSLEKAIIAGSITSIEDAAFKGCTSLANVQLGGGLRTIGASAFENTSLANIWLPASLTSIGVRAFAANEHLEYVVAASSVQDVDTTALADCTNTEIYVPVAEDSIYSWTAGVPATGNHLIPYGVRLAEEPLTLHQDESADLLEGGSLNADGRIQVSYAYDAAPISVDTETATIKAKQTGKTTVTAHLKIDDKSLASASRTVIVALAPEPETLEEDDGAEEGDGHDHEGGEIGELDEWANMIEDPTVDYTAQLFEEGDYYTSGIHDYEEKVINRTVTLANMDADIATMSLEVPSVDSYTGGSISTMSGTNKKNEQVYDAATQTLTWTMSPTCWHNATKCGGSVACSTDGHGFQFRKSRTKLNAIRKLVLVDWDKKNPQYIFSKMMNLETVEIRGNFLSNSYVDSRGNTKTSGVTDVSHMFEDCPQLRVIPSNMTLPSAVKVSHSYYETMFGFSNDQFGGSFTSLDYLQIQHQTFKKNEDLYYILSAYSGSDEGIKYALNMAEVYGAAHYGSRKFVNSYHTVTFDHWVGLGKNIVHNVHSAAGEPGVYTIKVPHGSPIPQLVGAPYCTNDSSQLWQFYGYVDELDNSPTQLICKEGYPPFSTTDASMLITSDMTLKALWVYTAIFKTNAKGHFDQSGQWKVCIPRNYPVAKPTGFSCHGESNSFWEVKRQGVNESYTAAPEIIPDGDAVFLGYTLKSIESDYPNAVAYYDRNRNPTSQIFDKTWNFYAMWGSNYTITWNPNGGYWDGNTSSTGNKTTTVVQGDTPTPPAAPARAESNGFAYDFDGWGTIGAATGNATYYAKWKERELKYTISFYSNVKLSWSWQDKYRNSSNQGVSYGSSGTGTSNANYGSAFQIANARSYTRWNSGFFNIRNSDAAYPVTKPGDPNNYAINYRDVSWTAPAYHTLESIRLNSATGTEIAAANDFYGYKKLTSNVSIYLIFKDETPTDTIKWKANGGYLNGNTGTTETSNSVKRGTKVTAPTIARASSSTTRYTFQGWYNGNTKVCDAGGQVTANGDATYTAKWKTEYKITWNLGMSGAHWGADEKDTGAKEIWVEAGGVVGAPATPTKKATSDTRWTWEKWNATVVTPATGPATYTGVWKTEYKTVWKLGSTEAYWGTNKNDKNNKEVWFKHGDKPTQPATPNRDAVAQYTYTFNSWNGITSTVTAPAEYTAIWDSVVRKYSITWVANGGYWGTNASDTANKTSKEQVYGTKLTGPTNGVPKRDHYTFLGWSTNKSSTGNDAVKEITVTGGTTYYAIWGLPYGFTIDPNGGEFKVPEQGLSGRTSQYLWTSYFKVIGHTLKFNVRKADGTFTEASEVNGTNIERPGYTFTGWKWGNNTSSPSTNLNHVEIGATYVAQWIENDITVKYQVGTAGGGNVSRASETVKAVTGTLAGSIPTHATGWHFVGWNTKADGTGQTLSTDVSTAFKPAKQSVSGWSYSLNVAGTYYAIFAPNGYTIELMKNDGTGDDGHGVTVGSISAAYDTPWTVRGGNVPNRRGYYFVGWDTDPDYKGMTPRFPHAPDADGTFRDKQFGEWVDGAFTGNLTTAEDGSGNAVPTTVKLYAIWNESRYTVIFDENWGLATADETLSGSAPARIDPLYTDKVTIPGQNGMAWQGHYFAGWNTAADGSGIAYKTGTVCQFVGHAELDDAHVRGATVRLYAQWEPNMYLVMFEANTQDEWSVVAGDQVLTPYWGDEVTIRTEFARPGYEFVGWSFQRNVASDASGTPIVDYKVGDTFRNLTDERNKIVQLYAQWKGAPYQILFDANADAEHQAVPGPDGPMAALDMFLGVGRPLPKNTYECPGFAFKGWNTKPDGTGEAYTDTQLVQDIPGIHDGTVTLYAQWSPVISMTSPINAHIEVYIDGMDVKVTAVKPGSPQDAIESHTRGKLFVEAMELEPNLDAQAGMARIFPVDGTPTRDSWEDFTLEFTALNEDTGKQVKSSIDFGNGFAFLPGQRNNYYVPAYDTATSTPGRLQYKLSMGVPEDAPVRYSEDPVQVGTLIFTCSLAE